MSNVSDERLGSASEGIQLDIRSSAKKILPIQYLRGIAAILVVFHHARNPLPWLYNPLAQINFGMLGVDIFFVISGFIMFIAARDETPVQFAKKRLIRIVPLYWVATGVWISYELLVFGSPFTGKMADGLVKSLLFIPFHNDHNANGHIWPVLSPGWTLNYEMFFYLLFAIGLATGRVATFVTISVIGLYTAGKIWSSNDPRWLTYTNFVMLEFVAGIAIAKLYQHRLLDRFLFCLPIGLILLCLSDFISVEPIVAASLIVIGALALPELTMVKPVLKKLGDASYSIYLFHLPVVTSAQIFVHDCIPDIGPLQIVTIVSLSFIGSICVGILMHDLLEKPIQSKLSGPKRN